MEIPATEWSAGRAYHFLTHAVAPRPIAWVTTLGDVVNAAPFSWFQSISADPPMLMVAIAKRDGHSKDTSHNLQTQGECVVHVVTSELAEAMVATSANYPRHESEVDALGLHTVPSVAVAPPRLVGPPVAFECQLDAMHDIGDTDVMFLRIVHTYIDDDAMDTRGNLLTGTDLMARLGGRSYIQVKDTTELPQE